MKIVDLNILIYAINASSPHHAAVRRWWEDALNGLEPIGLCWPVLSGFVRLTTNPRIFPRPLSVSTTLAHVDRWLGLPAVRIVGETDEHWRTTRDLLAQTGAAGNLTTDAHLASLAICHAGVLYSCDNDFARFPGLRWKNPLR